MKNNKSLGQHWLKNREILNQIATLSCPKISKRACLEIGPGLGTLTSSLLKHFSEVIAIEFDQKLAENLPKSFPGKNLKVINEDILKFDLNTIETPYVVAGNIPYYITSPIITKLLTSENKPERIVLLIQKEVAERIAAAVGHHTFLSLFVQNFASVELGPVVGREEFTPPPKVDSQVIILTPLKTPQISKKVLNFAKIGFSSPRKKLTANLATFYHLDKQELGQTLISLDLNPDCRPSDLTHQDWQRLYDIIKP